MPGVTVRSAADASEGQPDEVRTDVAAFLGLAERGMTQFPVRLQSWEEYLTMFGGHVRGAYLSHAVQAFFANGGRACWVVRIATRASWRNTEGRAEHVYEVPHQAATDDLALELRQGISKRSKTREAGERYTPNEIKDTPSGGAPRRRILLTAVSPGPWGRRIHFDLRQLDFGRYGFELRCPGSPTEIREGLNFVEIISSLNEDFEHSSRFDELMQSGTELRSSFERSDVQRPQRAGVVRMGSDLARARLQLCVPVPRIDSRPERDDSNVDLVLTFEDYAAWNSRVCIGWSGYADDELSLTIEYFRPDDGRRARLVYAAADCVQLVREITSTSLPGFAEGLGIRAHLEQRSIDLSRADGVREYQESIDSRVGAEDLVDLEQLVRHHVDRQISEGGEELDEEAREARVAEEMTRFGWVAQQGDPLLRGLEEKHLVGSGATDRSQKLGLELLADIEEIGTLAFPDLSTICAPSREVLRLHDLGVDRFDMRREQSTDLGALFGLPEHENDRKKLGEAFERFARVQQRMIEQCEARQDRMAILDTPPSRWNLSPARWRTRFDSTRAAIYFPWLQVERARGGVALEVPPCGHVAGVYAKVERTRGPHRSPANVAIECCLDVSWEVTDRNHAELNDLGVNVIRSQPGRGIRALGARTLASPTRLERSGFALGYVGVRRLLNWIIVSLERRLAWTVFEPNGERLREEVERVVRSFLLGIWRRGMLGGESAGGAFHVVCDESNNPPLNVHEVDPHENRLVCEFGIRAPSPTEYLVVRLTKQEDRMSFGVTAKEFG